MNRDVQDKRGPMVLTKDAGRAIAEEWIASWNSRDLDRILSLYSDDLEFSSIFILEFGGEPTGTLRGKERVGDYWSSALTQSSGPDARGRVQRSGAEHDDRSFGMSRIPVG